MRRLVRFSLATMILCIPFQVTAQTRGPSNGSLVIVGGAMRDPGIMQRFLDLAGGPDAPIVVIPTAGGADEYDQFYQGLKVASQISFRNLWFLPVTGSLIIKYSDHVHTHPRVGIEGIDKPHGYVIGTKKSNPARVVTCRPRKAQGQAGRYAR